MISKFARKKVIGVLMVTAALVMVIPIICFGLVSAPSFDGAMMLNTARNFVETGRYGYTYDTFFPFPTQTDGLMVLLAALSFKCFGITIVSAQIPSILFVVTLMMASAVLLWRSNKQCIAPVLAGFVVVVPGVLDYALGGYGEVPVLALMVSAICVFGVAVDRESMLAATVAGLLTGFALTIKVMTLMLAAPFWAMLMLYVWQERVRRVLVAWIVAGTLIPPFAWEVFRLSQLGVKEYKLWWKLQLRQVARQSGVGHASGHVGFDGHITRANVHLHLLSSFYETHAMLIFCALLVWAALVVFYIFYRLQGRSTLSTSCWFVVDAIAAMVAAMFLWWFFVVPTEGAWIRRILDGECLLLLSTLLLYSALSLENREGQAVLLFTMRVAALVTCALLVFQPARKIVTELRGWRRAQTTALAFVDLSRHVAALPKSAHVFGMGWWQAPEVSLFSGRSFENLNHWFPQRLSAATPFYVVYDFYAEALAQDDVKNVLSNSDWTKLISNSAGALYKIGVYRGVSTQLGDIVIGKDCSAFKAAVRCYGVYADGWVRPMSEFAVRWPAGQTLMMKVLVPSHQVKRFDLPDTISIEMNGCDPIEKIVEPGEALIRIPSCDSAGKEPVVAISTNFMVQFEHQIDADNRPISFKLLEVSFVNNQENY